MTDKEIFIALCSNDKLVRSDAIIYLEGDGLNRTSRVAELYHAGWADKVVFTGGAYNEHYGSLPYSLVAPGLEKEIDANAIILDEESMHTRQQAENMIRMCRKNSWKSLILVASHYHQYRAFLTFLKVLTEENLHRIVRIINAPADQLDWFRDSGYGGSRYLLLEKEFEKIDDYFANGHIASYEEAIKYFEWKELSH
jgi:uncharacterized SAM-binding protein YcdF (DUF218 family)